MATTGTYSFDPTLGELIIAAFGKIGIRRTDLVAPFIQDGRMCANLVLSEWSNKQVNLWKNRLVTTTLIDGTATYTCSSPVVQVLDMYISDGTSDRLITAVSHSEYAAIPMKQTAGPPTQFWFNRQRTPTLTFWPVPSGSNYTANYYCVTQFEDAEMPVGLTVDIPYRFMAAFVDALAWRLADMYKPELSAQMQQEAERSWQLAATQDTEDTPLYVRPVLSEYWR